MTSPVCASPPRFDEAFRATLQDLFIWRRDVRRFRSDPVDAATLNQLLQIACLSPSVGLSQPWRFVVVEDGWRRAKIRANFESCNAAALKTQERQGCYARLKLAGLDQAPKHLAVFVQDDPVQGSRLGRATMPETTAYSAVIAIHTFWLAARAIGLGMGWVSILDRDAVAKALDVPEDWTFIGYFCIGFPLEDHLIPELEREGWEHRRPIESQTLYR